MESEEAKEIYAHFGLAFYESNCLEHGVANALCYIKIFLQRKSCGSQKEWEGLIDKHFDESFEETLGRLIKQLEFHQDTLPSLLIVMADLEKCRDERNFLAHHFYREYAQGWFSFKGRKEMIERLQSSFELFFLTDRKLTAAVKSLAEKYGLTEEAIEKCWSEMMKEAEDY